jgi:hypothetical protein
MRTSSRALCLSLASFLPFAVTGCNLSTPDSHSTAAPSTSAGMAIQGAVHGGQQPIVGAHVYLFAANTTGYGGSGIAPSASNASVSLLSAASTGQSDSIGAYVLTDGNGGFSITGDYTCTQNSQVYLYALGGNPGAGINSAAGLLAILGNCPSTGNFLGSTPFISVNEVSTIAAAFASSGFASDATHVSSSGTARAQTGIQNAFANAANLANISTGAALATTPAGNGTAPQTTINTLANILASCVNSTGAVTGPASPTPCYSLFNNALSGLATGTLPSDTATAAINIAHHPGTNVAALYALPTPTAPFAPPLSAQPNDLTIMLNFTGNLFAPINIAIDASGNAWTANVNGTSVTKFSSMGAVLSGANGYSVFNPWALAIDDSGNAWVGQTGGNITKLSNSGAVLSGINGFTGSGLGSPLGAAMDGIGNAWFADQGGSVTEYSNSGAALSGTNGYTGGGLNESTGIAIDGSGNAWVTNFGAGNGTSNSVTKLSNGGAILSGANGYSGGSLTSPYGIAIDGAGNVWIANANSGGSGVTKLSNSGSLLINVSNGTGGIDGPTVIAIDGAGNAWVARSSTSGNITGLSSTGAVLSGATGYTGGGRLGDPGGIAIDGPGNAWVTDRGTGNGATDSLVSEFIGVATPVITPLAAGLPATPTTDGSSSLGTRPRRFTDESTFFLRTILEFRHEKGCA